MLKINFKVDTDIIARLAISQSLIPVDFANYLWEKYNNSYVEIQRRLKSENIEFDIIRELQQQSFFQDYLKQANDNLIRIEKNWIENEKDINAFLLKTIKTDFNLNVICYIIPPQFMLGRKIYDNSFIWGHLKGLNDVNYDLVYLVHESLHSYFENDDLSHAIIEEIADKELSKLLNKNNVEYNSHNSLINEHVKIFPFWNLYLNKTTEEIKQEMQFRNIEYNINDFEKYRDMLCEMNIHQFINFLKDKIKTINFKTTYKII